MTGNKINENKINENKPLEQNDGNKMTKNKMTENKMTEQKGWERNDRGGSVMTLKKKREGEKERRGNLQERCDKCSPVTTMWLAYNATGLTERPLSRTLSHSKTEKQR